MEELFGIHTILENALKDLRIADVEFEEPVADVELEESAQPGYFDFGFYAIPEIRKVYFNNKHTTIEWEDNTKTTVGCMEGQVFDEYAGFTAAIAKKIFGTSSAAIRCMNEYKVVQKESVKKSRVKKETGANQDA